MIRAQPAPDRVVSYSGARATAFIRRRDTERFIEEVRGDDLGGVSEAPSRALGELRTHWPGTKARTSSAFPVACGQVRESSHASDTPLAVGLVGVFVLPLALEGYRRGHDSRTRDRRSSRRRGFRDC